MSGITLLERLRLDKGWERVHLTDVSGVPVRTIRQLESGQTQSPRLATLKPLADALDTTPSALAADFRSVPA